VARAAGPAPMMQTSHRWRGGGDNEIDEMIDEDMM